MPSAFNCPNCGAPIEVIAGRTDVKCAACGTVTNLSDLLARMTPVETPQQNDRVGPINLLIFGNQVGCCGCLAGLVTVLIIGAIILFIIAGSTPGGFSGILTQAAH